MDPIIPRKRGRPRKKPLVEDEEKSGINAKKNAVAGMRSVALVGRYVLKNFEGNGTFLGKVVNYDTGLYRVDYEDGDCEDLESRELRQIILDESAFTSELNKKRNRLDKRIRSKSVKSTDEAEKKKEVDTTEVASSVTELTNAPVIENNGDGDEVGASDIEADSSSDSCEYAQDSDGALEVPPLPHPPELPTSSENIGIPEEYVSHLFSVYGVLRSFSIPLFLYPFGLDDFVGALNCTSPNTLLDAIHVALMRALKLHLENISSEDSELASKCLRSMDWDLLDTMTWPIYVIHYLTTMGHLKGEEWRGFHDIVLVREYYTLHAGQKLLVLQILCNDILDYSEVRAEIDTRVASEVGTDLDVDNADSLESGPRRVHPRYSKTSAWQNRDSVGVIAESDDIRSQFRLNSKVNHVNKEGFDTVKGDGNYDECRLCGMYGTLLCCDGCPSAFHSRCVGVTKMHISEGPWFCPECTISKNGPPIAVGTLLVGAVMFGIDPYERAFLGTHNHLLVKTVSASESKCLRYYSQRDISKVLQVLNSSAQHMALYADICKRIVQYWNIPEDVFSFSEMIETHITQLTETENVKDEPLVSSVHERQKILEAVDCAEGSMVDSMAISTAQACGDMTCVDTLGSTENGESSALKHLEQIRLDSASSAGSVDQQTDPPHLTQQNLFDKSAVIHAICTSRSSSSFSGHPGGMRVPTRLSCNKEPNNAGFGGTERDKTDDSVYFGSRFKSHMYMNQYWHGYFAASAAASLATLSAEEGQADGHATGHPKKPVSAIFQQTKAFSSVATRFFWPSPEKKLWEVPRERCSWCYSCKAPISSRRGCMLNAAASAAIKGTVKILSGLQTPKIGEGSIPIIATYILLIEESFRGLIGGRFLIENYRKTWRELVEQTTSSVGIKSLLLELEEHIRLISLSSDWVKLVDDHLIGPSVTQVAATVAGSTQRRGPGRRNKRQSVASQITDGDCLEKVFCWWRRGKLSKLLLHKATLPRSVMKRAARQGGLRKISVLNYASGSEIPRRSKQLLWRAAVERSKNASQLALQVRCLDFYLRWNDVVRPEPNIQDGKTAESDASIFRNASICDKKIAENKISYGVDFGVQKHLPSRIMKCVVDVEKNGGNDRYWFSEAHVPLYLIKEYEESVNKVSLLSAQLPVDLPLKMRATQLKAARMDLFSYLIYRRDNKNTISCALCHQIVPLRKVVKCSACRGYCHESCTMDSKTLVNGEVRISIACKRCFNAKAFSGCESTESPTSPLLLQTQEKTSSGTVPRVKVKGYTQPLASSRKLESSKEIKPIRSGSATTTKTRTRIPTWGIIWRKKNTDDTGFDFRQNNILLRGCDDLHWPGPVCHLCQKPYNSDLMYIRCSTCTHWYHADALELHESKFFDVVGFKCCKCRRIKSPECPYDDRTKKRVGKKEQNLVFKTEPASSDSDYGKFSEWIDLEPSTPIFPPEEKQTPIDDPLLQSSLKVEQITDANVKAEFGWNTASGPALQKLPVRRHVKREHMENSSGNDIYYSETTAPQEVNIQGRQTEKASFAPAEWDISSGALDGEVTLDGFTFEDMEFEPQTYFTFGELLADQSDDIDASQDVSANWENGSSAVAWDGVPDDRSLVFSDDGVEPMISIDPAVDAQCGMCSDSEHVPDLFCHNCGLWIHRQCSPWVEMESVEGDWKCGNCREWR